MSKYLDKVRQAMPSWTVNQLPLGLNAYPLFYAVTESLEKQRPIWVAITISNLNEDMVASMGIDTLDDFLLKEAKRQGKQVHGVERAEDQCKIFNDLDTDLAILSLNVTLEVLEKLRMGTAKESPIEKLITGYRQGSVEPGLLGQEPIQIPKNASSDLVQKIKQVVAELKEFQADVFEKRNKKMAARIIDVLREKPDAYFFAFGTGHFIGKDNIPDIIRSAGFEVEQVGRFTSDSVAPKPTAAIILMMVGLILCLKL